MGVWKGIPNIWRVCMEISDGRIYGRIYAGVWKVHERICGIIWKYAKGFFRVICGRVWKYMEIYGGIRGRAMEGH